jgi:hypothetical protein
MSNYQEGGGPYSEGTPGENPSYGEPSHGGPGGYQGGSQGGAPHYETSQFGSAGGQQQWAGQPGYQGNQGYQGQGRQDQGGFLGGGAAPGRNLQVRSTFLTTEFWIFVVLSLALLIASAVSDDQGFAAQDAWKYVTWLAIAYILSRGLTKFAGHERGRGHDHGDRH